MPLVRYEIRNEHSLANPQLYRTAAKDDPEGLLEGVAMAGLVGIVRQLGDLAEFAAEVFRDLHEEVMATASRGHELLARVQQLEAEMPAVEKALLSETNQLRFAYTPGAEWHASIRNDQNHCTQGDLPRFIRNSYEECRGPPRLFLLDKFDVAGAGACLKRYTDPSFFRTEWASSELMKAERVQRDKKARREKKKGRRRRNVDGKESIPVDQFHTRFSHELKEPAQPVHGHSRSPAWTLLPSHTLSPSQSISSCPPGRDSCMCTAGTMAWMWHQPVSGRSEEAASVVENMNYNDNLNAISRHLAEAQGLSRDVTRTGNVASGEIQDAVPDDIVGVPRTSNVSRGEIQLVLCDDSMDIPKASNIPPDEIQEALPDDFVHVPVPTMSETLPSSQSMTVVGISAIRTEREQRLRKLEEAGSSAPYKDENVLQEQQEAIDVVDDGASEGDQFLDALTTMESEADSDSEPGFKQDRDTEADTVTDTNEDRSTLQENLRSPGLHPASSEEKMNMSVDHSQTTSQEDLKLSSLNETSTGSIVTPPLEHSLTASQEDSRSPGPRWTSTNGDLSLSATQSPSSLLLNTSGKDFSHDSSVTVNGLDIKGIPSSTTPVHVKRHSTDSISSSSFRKAKHVQSLDEPWENVAAHPKLFTSMREERGVKKSFEPGTVSSGNAGVMVSKMVAAFERGSLEQIHDEEPEDKRRGNGRESTTLEPVAQSINQAAEEMVNADILEDHKADNDSLHDSHSPGLASPASSASTTSKVLSTRCHASPSPPQIRMEDTSPSCHVSQGSLDSLPDSPIFSALHSPMSPIRTTRNILSSPDSHGLGFTTDLLSPGSPTSVPILALSPTSQKVSRSFVSLGHGDHQTLQSVTSLMVDEPFHLFSPSSPPAELSLALPQEHPETAFWSPTISNIISNTTAPLPTPAESSNDHFLPAPEGSHHDLPHSSPTGTPPIGVSDIISPLSVSLGDSKGPNATLISLPDVVHTSNSESELCTSPRIQRVRYSGTAFPSPSFHVSDDIATSSVPDDDSPDHASSKAGESVLLEPILPPSPLPSELFHDSTLQNTSKGKHDKPLSSLSTRSDEMASKVSRPEAANDLQFPNHMIAHRRFPSLPPPASTTDFVSDLSSKSSQELPPPAAPSKPALYTQVSASKFGNDVLSSSPLSPKLVDSPASPTPSKPVPAAQVSASTSVHNLPSPSLPSQKLHDLPFPVPKSSHKRFPSFPYSEKAVLEFDSSSSSSSKALLDHPISSVIPSRPATDARVPKSKLVHARPSPSAPSQALQSLPPSTPSKSEHDSLPPPTPSKSEHDSLLSPSTPFRTFRELPPPPPPLRTPPPISIAKSSIVVDVQDALLDAIASHDKSTLKKVKTMQNPSLRKEDGRSHLLEQIRAQSFNLRHTVVEKFEPPLARPVTNINVAAILEKANAIRQAFAGSDEDDDDDDDDWSDV